MTSNRQEGQVAESSQMAIMRAIQQELAELRAENASIKRKLESNNEGEGEQPRPSKTQATFQPVRNAPKLSKKVRRTPKLWEQLIPPQCKKMRASTLLSMG